MNSENTYTQRNQSNSKKVMLWSMLWAFTLLLAAASAKLFGPLSLAFIVIVVLSHVFFAGMALKAHKVWLRGLDEFQKQIQLYSMAFTLGMTWIVVILMQLLDILDVLEVGENHLVFLSVMMAVTGAIGTMVSMRKSS